MNINHWTRPLQGDEVVSLPTNLGFLISHTTFRVGEFLSTMNQRLGKQDQWFAEGVECEVLAPGTGWQKGKVRIRLEFCPQEPVVEEPVSSDLEIENAQKQNADSPLDEIRLRMQEGA